eukprot:CAMPEP_0194392448 /NCGR_PEP_ID=MMETSP0174-20130528/121923_1 /TAXON_ID=216777 /ORGANISM="Proboscia alata, Strain PI-D3" /LENGTH=40 /DNA_ID= /DNA_START= /DNA_END= /DNA_ORIENTATION=
MAARRDTNGVENICTIDIVGWFSREVCAMAGNIEEKWNKP